LPEIRIYSSIQSKVGSNAPSLNRLRYSVYKPNHCCKDYLYPDPNIRLLLYHREEIQNDLAVLIPFIPSSCANRETKPLTIFRNIDQEIIFMLTCNQSFDINTHLSISFNLNLNWEKGIRISTVQPLSSNMRFPFPKRHPRIDRSKYHYKEYHHI